MKFEIDTNRLVDDGDADVLGSILMMMLSSEGGSPYRGREPVVPGWSKGENISDDLLRTLMGDGVDEGFTPTHIVHDRTGLQVMWYSDGDMTVMFHMPADEKEAGFTITNSHNGSPGYWRFED